MFKKPESKLGIFLWNAMIVLSSAAIGSFVQIFVMIPNGMTSGGVPGIARLITHFFPIRYSLVYYIIQMGVMILSFVTMGKKELGRIIALGLAYPVMLFIFEHFHYSLLDSNDQFLAAILIGVMYGLCTAIGYIGGYSSGGTDSIARIIKFKVLPHLRVGDIQMAMDVVIVLISAFVFNTNVAFYAVISSFVSSKVISAVMLGVSGKFIQFDIISEKPEEITDFILQKIGRAVTSHIGTGEYTHTQRKTLTVLCTPNEAVKIKKFVAETDPKAFATAMPVISVWGMGKGFSDITEIDNN